MACTGLGATMVFSNGVTWTGRIRSIAGFREFCEILDDTALDSTGYRESCPDDLNELDPLEITFHAPEGSPRPPIAAVGDAILTFGPAESGSATLTGSGFFSEWLTPEQTPGVMADATTMWKFDNKGTPPVWGTVA